MNKGPLNLLVFIKLLFGLPLGSAGGITLSLLIDYRSGQHAEIDLSERDLAKANFDGVSHYLRPDILSLPVTMPGPIPAPKSCKGGSEAEIIRRYLFPRPEIRASRTKGYSLSLQEMP